MGNGFWGSSLGLKRPWRDSEYSAFSSAGIKNVWSYSSLSLYAVMACKGKTVPFYLILIGNTVGRAVSQGIYRRPITAKAQVQSLTGPLRFLVDKVALGEGFLREDPILYVGIISLMLRSHFVMYH